MIFDRITQAPCIVQLPEPPDPRCSEPDYALQHPSCVGGALILKPAVATLCLWDSLVFTLFEFVGGVETELTSGVSFASSDPTVFAIGVNSGSGTVIGAVIGAGTAIITATYGSRTVQATITAQPEMTCCDETIVETAIVVDNSRSMSLAFAGYGSRLAFAKAAAAAYGGLIEEVNGAPKDSVSVWSVNATLTQLLSASEDTAVVLDAIAGIPQTQLKTDLLPVFAVAAQDLLAGGPEKRVLFLISDCEQTVNADRQAILDAAFAFKQAGGIVVVFAARASGVLQGFDLAERIATPGYFINATGSNAAAAIEQLAYLKKLLCAGPCVDAGDRYEHQPALAYSSFLNWEVVYGIVNLLGPGLMDFLPGNGLYVELAGQAHAVIGTIDAFDIVAGQTYLIHFKAAGNQQSQTAAQSISASIRIGPTNTFATNAKAFEQTVFPAWNDGFGEYNFTFTALADATVRLYFEQNYAGSEVPGSLLDDVQFKNETTGAALLLDNFDGENLVYIPPACGASAGLEAIDDPEAPVVTQLSAGGAAAALPFTEAYAYSITAVTNEGETAETLCSVDPTPPTADEAGDINRVTWPAPYSDRIVGWRLWRSLGEDLAGWTGTSEPRYLLAELNANETAYMDSEHIAEFTARYEPSVTAPTVNTTAVTPGGLGSGHAGCCYESLVYYGGTGVEASELMTGNLPSTGLVDSGTDQTAEEDWWIPFREIVGNPADDNRGMYFRVENVTGIVPDTEWLQYNFPSAKTWSSYAIATQRGTETNVAPTGWILSGSNNGVDFTTLDILTGIVLVDDVPRTFGIAAPSSFLHYRITFTNAEFVPAEVGAQFVLSQLRFFSGWVIDLINNCPACLAEVPGLQAADSMPLADIESGPTPPVQQTFNSTKCVSCDAGDANLPVFVGALEAVVLTNANRKLFNWSLAAGSVPVVVLIVGNVNNGATYILRGHTSSLAGTINGGTVVQTGTSSSFGLLTFEIASSGGFIHFQLDVTNGGSADEFTATASLSIIGPSTACASATSTVSQSAADASATAAARLLLTCTRIYTETVLHTSYCPFGTVGSATRPGTGTSYKSQAEAHDRAVAAAEAAADAALAADPAACTGSNNMSGITILDNTNANPYPSVQYISGAGTIAKVVVTINGITHGSADDLRILLVSPEGTAVWLMKDCGGANALSNVNLVFDDTGGALPDETQITSGTYEPTIFSGNQYPPLPAPPQDPDPLPSLTLAAFIGEDKQGAWQLYVSDDLAVGTGSIVSWALTIT